MKKLNKVLAFTLAEVLITLGIIGVVAAMTIPTLLNNLQNRKLESQFKEGYSILSQAFKSWQDDGYEYVYPVPGSFYRSFMSYFTGVTDCGDTNSTKDDDEYCIMRTSNADGSGSHVTNRDLSYRTFSKKSKQIATYNLDDGQFYLQNGIACAYYAISDSGYFKKLKK